MKKTKFPNTTEVEYSITNFASGLDALTDENNTKFNKASNTYNFEYRNGALTECLGFEDLTIPSYSYEGSVELSPRIVVDEGKSNQFLKVYHYKEYDPLDKERKDKIFLIATDFIPTYSRAITQAPIFYHLSNVVPTEMPRVNSYHTGEKDCILFHNDTDDLIVWDNYNPIRTFANAPKFYDLCVFNEKLILVPSGERLKLRIENDNLLNLTETYTTSTKIINLDTERGYINKLLSFNNSVYIIRDFGISRLNRVESITHLLCSASRLYENTACICGNKGLVLGKDGLYEFGSVEAEKLNLKLNRMLNGVPNQYAVASFKNGIYYLACRLNFNDNKQIGCESGTFKNNALIAINTQNYQYTITRGVDISDLCTIQYGSCDKLVATFYGSNATKIGQICSNGKLFGVNESRFWSSPLTDLGFSNKIKYVKEVSLLSLYDIKVKVFSECESREFNIKGSNIISRFPVRIKGKQIGILISSNTDKAYISNLKLFANLIDNEYV
jgi:hypothetical protein